jgi:head-tail adaptor
MAIGGMKHRVRITAPANVLAPTPVVVDQNVPAAIVVVPLNFQAYERMQASGLQASTTYTVKLRYRTDLTEAMHLDELCCTQRHFQILAIVPTDRRDGLELQCVTQGQA